MVPHAPPRQLVVHAIPGGVEQPTERGRDSGRVVQIGVLVIVEQQLAGAGAPNR